MTSRELEDSDHPSGFASVGSVYYPVLVAVFTALVIISNVTATKGVAFGPIITDGGFIVFPLTYVIGDVLSEVYGFKAARARDLPGLLDEHPGRARRSGSRSTCRPPTSIRTRRRSRTSCTPTPS